MRVSTLAVLALCGTAAEAQEPPFSKQEQALVSSFEAAVDSSFKAMDAFLLCPVMLVREAQAQTVFLEADGWKMSLHYQDATDPYFAEYEGSRTYDDGSAANLYGGSESYPGMNVSYCALTFTGEAERLSLSLADELAGAEAQWRTVGADQYGTWRLVAGETFYARAAITADHTYIQYTLITPNLS